MSTDRIEDGLHVGDTSIARDGEVGQRIRLTGGRQV
jgi:hypothetical protein